MALFCKAKAEDAASASSGRVWLGAMGRVPRLNAGPKPTGSFEELLERPG